MLRGFSVSNFKSFNETQTLTMSAGKIQRHSDHVKVVGNGTNNRRILRSAAIFGANAGGKTNLIEAMAFSRNIIINGLNTTYINKKYFRVKKENYEKPGVFQYSFILDDKEYSYGIAISYSEIKIVSEWLISINLSNKKEFVIFDRNDIDGKSTVTTDIKSTSSRLKFYYEDFEENITDDFRKKTILSDISQRSNDHRGHLGEIKKIYTCFQNFTVIYPNSKYRLINEIATDENRKQFFEEILASLDTGIESISEQKRAMDLDKLLSDAPEKVADQIKTYINNGVSHNPVLLNVNGQPIFLQKDKDENLVYHKLLLNHGNSDDLFEYMDESDGTQRLFDLIPLLYNNSKGPRVILIDEIDRSLHTNLVRRFLELFFQYTEGTETQIIFTTQDSNIMDLDLFRQDEIWFVERQKDHSSELYSLNKFNARFDKIVKDDYLIGRYGAIPFFKDLPDDLEEDDDEE